ncbi:MAG TPA: hypothetical protein VKZ49_10915 [Polyangiaceae bacterium]|nr:hypothetical protein [Polyangiaceae bacterium]
MRQRQEAQEVLRPGGLGAGARGSVLAGALICSAPALRAEEPPAAEAAAGAALFTLDYQVPPGCPDATEFLRQVLARTTRARPAEPGAPASRAFRVRATELENATEGLIGVHGPLDERSERRVVGRDCREAITALALVAALTLDPEASTAPIEAAPSTPPPAPKAATNSAPIPSPGPPAPPPRSPSRSSPASGPTTELGFGVQLQATPVISGDLMPRELAYVELGWRTGLEPRVRAGAVHGRDDVSHELGAAAMAQTAGFIDVCPLDLLRGASWRLLPCAGIEAGTLQGEGQPRGGALTAARAGRLWLASNFLARLGWQPVSPLTLEAQVGLLVPWVRDTFVFETPDGPTSIFQVPSTAFVAAAGIGATLPF